MEFTSLDFSGDSTLYIATNNGKVSAWDTRHNTCFMHWEADNSEIGMCPLYVKLFLPWDFDSYRYCKKIKLYCKKRSLKILCCVPVISSNLHDCILNICNILVIFILYVFPSCRYCYL